jgi:hypothetical protein
MWGADIVTINPDATGRQTHGTVPSDAVMYDADLSPDGTTFAGPRGEGDVGVWNWTTGATAEYTNDGEEPGMGREWMTWSPDGTKILYAQAGNTVTGPGGGGGNPPPTGGGSGGGGGSAPAPTFTAFDAKPAFARGSASRRARSGSRSMCAATPAAPSRA